MFEPEAEISARGVFTEGWQHQLGQARRGLETGDVEAARQRALAALQQAEALADANGQAQALMVLAQYDRIVGRFERAIVTAQRSVQLFQLDGDLAGEANALSLLAHACSYLGRNEDAVEAGLLSVRLGELLPPGPQRVNLYNYLGVAYLWAHAYGSAETALREAERLALLYGAGSNVLLPRINLAWLECVRLFQARYFSGSLPATGPLRERLQQCAALFDDDLPFPGLPGVRAILQRFGRCAWALLHCWDGELASAQRELDAAQDRSRPGQYAQVANFIVHWVRAELCWAHQDLAGAEREAAALVEHSGRADFEQTAYLGHVLLGQLYRAQGKHALAQDEERAHRARELRVSARILDNRHRVVEAQLEMRSNRRHLESMSAHSMELERLSFEDSLTGIANRRRFDQQLAMSLADRRHAPQPLCVALIDLDDFKRVNDTFSHAAGDAVLKSVARAMKSCVRETDLAARLGGDEFVILFVQTDEATARQVCRRMQARVERLRWPKLAPGLRVGISIGVAQAEPGDTPAGLLQRSDAGMFKAKGRRPKAALG